MDTSISIRAWEDFEMDVVETSHFIDDLLAYLKKTIVGQEVLLERLLIGLIGNGHLLLEGFPGLAKTLAVKSLAQAININFNRIQFTPDILPADILGTMIFNIGTNEFTIKKGPIFSNFVLADEINRAPEKVQSALLEVMQEHQVTIGNITHHLDSPFMVLATQNPIDQSGTYVLPEAQMDRFMMKILISYPSLEEERLVVRMNHDAGDIPKPIFTAEQVLLVKSLVKKIHVDTKVETYILQIIFATRFPEEYNLAHLKPYIRYGSSPRGSINLTMASRAHAFIKKRAFVIPEDVKAIVFDVLRHRIGLTYMAVAENITTEFIIQQIIDTIPMP
jgi:MoxR-like ATPase